jgi:two-component system cell cycle sensor histidine kinase/response regulator CckA
LSSLDDFGNPSVGDERRHLTTQASSEPRPDRRLSERRHAAGLLSVQSEILALLATAVPVTETVESIVAVLKRSTGFDAVGLRFTDGDDYPFLAALGYSEDFLRAENALVVKYPDGGICRNADGSVSLECTCGLVVSGRTDPTNPLFTPGGSAWTNDSFPILDLPRVLDPRLNPRNRCIHAGFQSIALIPLRAGAEILGLLHFADRHKDCFSLDSIRFFEGVAASMGMALRNRQTERALRESEAELKLTIDEAPVGMASVGLDQRFLSCNRAFCDFLGYSEEELLGRTITEITFPEDAEVGMADMRAIVAGEKKSSRVQKRYVRKDGSTVWGEVNINLLRDAQGRPLYFLPVIQDISERVQAEESLRSSEERFRGVLERTNAGYFFIDREGSFRRVNESWLRMHGYESADEVIGRHFSLTQPDADLQASQEVVESLLAGEVIPDGVFSRRRRDGSIGYHRFTARPVTEKGEAVGLEGFLFDITEHKQAEEELRESERRLTEAQRLGKIGSWEWIPAEDKVIWSAEMYAIFGIAPEAGSLTTEMTMQAFHPDDRALVAEATRKTLEERDPQPIECRILRPDGTVTYVYGRGEAVLDAKGELVKMTGIYQDITERKQAEEALRLSEEHLRQSQKMEAIGQLAGGIAHDFNNLLTAILGYSEMILASEASTLAEVRPDIEEIKLAGERAATLTKQILAFSRRQTLRPTAASLDDVLSGMEPLLRRTLGEDIDVLTLADSGVEQVEVDVHQLEQVILNLALNARDAMPSGGRLTLKTGNVELDEEYCRTHPEVAPGSFVMLSVSDTGVGMDQETMDRVFEPFFTTKAFGQGTGLGLAVIHGIVRQSQGSIFVQSEPGRGATFRIYLPRSAPTDVPRPVVISSHVSALGSETIMVVEDEAGLRSLIERILGEAGYTTLAFGSADEAIATLGQAGYPVDMLLTDVILPGTLQGHHLARAVRAARPDLPVLYISGYPRDALVHAGRLDEGVNLLEKPFTPEALATTVRRVLDEPRM